NRPNNSSPFGLLKQSWAAIGSCSEHEHARREGSKGQHGCKHSNKQSLHWWLSGMRRPPDGTVVTATISFGGSACLRRQAAESRADCRCDNGYQRGWSQP